MRKRFTKKIMAVVLSGALLISGISYAPATVEAHGTTDTVITESMLKGSDGIPSDYALNKATQGEAKDGTYEKYFLKEDVQEVRIKMDENNLNYVLQNALDKPTVMTDSVTIGDQTVQYTGFKTKGNYTLSATNKNDKSDRFSFTVNFGKYIKKKKYGAKQNFFGCNKISFNNFYFDKSMMVEYFSLKLMTEMGVPTPQYGLTKLYINDQYYGVYLMIEAMDSSIIEKYQKVDSKKVSDYLVKPSDETEGKSDGSKLKYTSALDSLIKEDGTFDLSSVLKENDKGEYEASGALQNQAALWEGDNDTLQDVAEVLPTVLSWEKKLNQLSEGKNFSGEKIDVNSEEYISLLSEVMDIEEVVKYFAVHSFLLQLDSIFQNYQNYGLYVDNDGKAMVIPWDYDLAFGRYHPGSSEIAANFDIDTMYWERRDYKDFPLFYVIYQNESLMKKYHEYMKDCSKIVALGGTTSQGKTYDAAYFNSYVEKMTDKLKNAINADKLASNVTYLNGQSQPDDCMRALPNLNMMMSMRAAGVAAQVAGEETIVSGNGCILGTVGNADYNGKYMTNGDITNIDAATGITVRGVYGDGKIDYSEWWRPGLNQGTAPTLTVSQKSKSSTDYKNIVKTLNTSSENITVFRMKNAAKANGTYTVTIPAKMIDSKEQTLEFYTFESSDGLASKAEGSLSESGRYEIKAKSVAYVVAVAGGTTKANPETVGTSYAINNVKYKITKTGSNAAVTAEAPKSKTKTSAVIANTVKINGNTYKVTQISANAFKECKKLKKVTIGTNVKKIGAKAFYGCKNLKTITIKSASLKASKVGSKAWKGIAAKAVVKVPKNKIKSYKKMMQKKGAGKKITVKA